MKNIFILFLIFVLGCGFVFAKNASDVYSLNSDSILFVNTQDALGTGVVLKEDGTFVTCFHVIATADYVKVKTKNGEEYKVDGYKYIDPNNDVAILTLKTTKTFRPIKISTQNPKVGEKVYAIGNPKGIKFVFSDGMINQIHNDIIQFSAPISSGSSGGALLNSEGELIGIVSFQYDPSVSQNLNFAIQNKYFSGHIEDKKNSNSKNLVWTDFLISKANKKQYENYAEYAASSKDKELLYRYLKPVSTKNKVDVEDYAKWGTRVFMHYMASGSDGKQELKEASRWYKLSAKNEKHLELSYYGLVLTAVLDNNKKAFDEYIIKLKPYTKSYKTIEKSLNKIADCEDKDLKCNASALENIRKRMIKLYNKEYK